MMALSTSTRSRRVFRRRRGLGLLVLAALAPLAACSGAAPDANTPLTNEPPYLCQVFPESALETIFPADEHYEEYVPDRIEGSAYYACDVSAGGKAGFGYRRVEGRSAEIDYEMRLQDDPPDPASEERLPPRMGTGWYTPRWPGDPTKAEPGSDVWAFWRCDSKPVLTTVVLGHGTPIEGRDPSKDIVRLMEIVQERYSELNGDCEIRPPESVPTDPTSTSSEAEGST